MNKEFKEFCPTVLLCTKEDTADLEYQESLPQYCEDVLRVIKCVCYNVVTDYENFNGTLKIYGKSRICLAYETTSNTISEAEFEETFIKNIECPTTDNFAFTKTECFTRFSNFRLINQRKIAIHSSVCIVSSIYEKKVCNALSQCDNAITKNDSLSMLKIVACGGVSADFDEEFVLPSGNTSVESVINTYSSVIINETKTIKDKMLIKAVIKLSVTYTNSDGAVDKNSFELSISKIIDAENADIDNNSFVSAAVSSLYVKAQPDDENNMRKFSVAGSVRFAYCITSVVNEELITDAYSTKYKSNIINKKVNVPCSPRYFCESKTLSCECTNDDSDIVEVIDMSVNILRSYIKESKLCIDAGLDILYYDSSSQIVSTNIKTSLVSQIEESTDNGIAFAQIESFDFVLTSSKTLELRLNVDYGVFLYTEQNIDYVDDIEIAEDVREETPFLTIYFANENETVWDIAKKFKTKSSLIMKENDITNEKIKMRRILLVPGV